MTKENTITINQVISNIEKRFGKEAIAGKQEGVEFVSSGSISLDVALGGGWAKGRIAEIYGWESSGKTTVALHLAAEIQRLGKAVVYIDTENSLDTVYAHKLGVNIEDKGGLWYLSQPEDGETAIEIGREFAKSKDVGLVVFDSVTSMLPRAQIQGEAGDQKMGLLARLMSQYMPTLKDPIKRSGCIILFINQLREKIGVMFGSSETTTGGNALKFYASQRVKISRSGQTKDNNNDIIANGTKCKVVKNKVDLPFKEALFKIRFGEGIDKLSEIIDIAADANIIQKRGSWYNYGDIKLGQGEEKVRELLKDNPELVEEIKQKIKQ
jgi:recombination protein RecA